MSTSFTGFYKAVVPILALATGSIWLIWCYRITTADVSRIGVRSLLLLLPVLPLAVYFFCFRLKKVEADDHRLYVSNFFNEISLPLADIESVSESWLINPKLVYIRLKTDSPFGRKIVFAPPLRVLSQFKHHPVVDDLRRMLRQHSY